MDKFDQVINRTLKTLKATIPPADYEGFREMCIQKMREEDRQTMDGFMVKEVLDQWNKNGYKQLAPKQLASKQIAQKQVPNLLVDFNGGLNDDAALAAVIERSAKEDHVVSKEDLAEVEADAELKAMFLSRYQNETKKQGALRGKLFDYFMELQDYLFDDVDDESMGCYCKEVKNLLDEGVLCSKSLIDVKNNVEKLRMERELIESIKSIKALVAKYSKRLTDTRLEVIMDFVNGVSREYNVGISVILGMLEELKCPNIKAIRALFDDEDGQSQVQMGATKKVSKKPKDMSSDDSDSFISA